MTVLVCKVLSLQESSFISECNASGLVVSRLMMSSFFSLLPNGFFSSPPMDSALIVVSVVNGVIAALYAFLWVS